MKSKEELYSLKSEVELLNNKLCELSDDELAQVVGGGKHSTLCMPITRYTTTSFVTQFANDVVDNLQREISD